MYLPFSSVNSRVIIAIRSTVTHTKMARRIIAGKTIGKKPKNQSREIGTLAAQSKNIEIPLAVLLT